MMRRRRAGSRNNAQKHGHGVDDSSPNCIASSADPTRCRNRYSRPFIKQWEKKNKKKDAEKKEKLRAKKEPKLNKKQTKKQKKAAKELGEEHIDNLVKEFHIANLDENSKSQVTVNDNVARPGPRCYANFTALPTGEICLFGGEYFDGKATYNYNDLYLYNPATSTWRTVVSDYCPAHALPTRP